MTVYECIIYAFGGVFCGGVVGLGIYCFEVSHNNWCKVFYLSLIFIVKGTFFFLLQPLLVFFSSSVRVNLVRLSISFGESKYNVSIPKRGRKSLEMLLLNNASYWDLSRVSFGLLRIFIHDFNGVCLSIPTEVIKLLHGRRKVSNLNKNRVAYNVQENILKGYKLSSTYIKSALAPLCL